MYNLSKSFHADLDNLEAEVSDYFNRLMLNQKEFIIFSESDLEYDIPDVYLEYRNINGAVIDVHPLKVTDNGIIVLEAEDINRKMLIKLSDLGSVQDRIILCELMENVVE